MKYVILQDNDASSLEKRVIQYLNVGYSCQGGSGHDPVNRWWYQAMIKL